VHHQQKNLKDSAMRTASTCFVVFWMTVCSAWGQESDKAEDIRQGHQLAAMLCAIAIWQHPTSGSCQI
jgi:hypothetical protein